MLLLHLRLPLHFSRVFSALGTYWAAGLRAHDALAALATICNALAIAQRDRLVEFIIIVQISDDVTL